MIKSNRYSNNQIVSKLDKDILTHYYKSGALKATGKYNSKGMQDKWYFYKESGKLWQIGHLKDNVKHGKWIRYNDSGNEIYNKVFNNGKLVK